MRIEKTVLLQAKRSRVWQALADAHEFGEWFGAKLDGAFQKGQTTRGQITHPGYEHLRIELQGVHLEPERCLSYRWHPYAIDPGVDYSDEPTTLVEFTLEDVGDQTKLKIAEGDFDDIPTARRAKAFEMNEKGWAAQLENIAKHLSRA